MVKMAKNNSTKDSFFLSRSKPRRLLTTCATATTLCLLSITVDASVVFKSDFETGDINSNTSKEDGWRKQTCKQDGLVVVKGGKSGAPRARSGKYILKSTSRRDDRPQKCNGRDKIRTELYGGGAVPPEKERWIGFSTYIPKKTSREDQPITFFQLHFASKGNELFNVEAYKGKYMMINYYASQGRRFKKTIAQIKYDTWTDWVFHLKFTSPSSKNMGYVQIWKDGKLVFDWKGHSLRKGSKTTAKRKIGQYVNKSWPRSNPSSMVIYHDAFSIADEKSSYKSVSPRGKSANKSRFPAAPTGLNVTQH